MTWRIRQLGIVGACCLTAIICFLTAGWLTNRAHADDTSATKITAAEYAEIYNLFSAYAYADDTGNGAARVATFTPDGTMSSPRSNHKPYHMAQLLMNTNASGQRVRPGVSRHMIFNIHITPTPTGADAFAYALFPAGEPEADSSMKLKPGFYQVTLVKTENGWRFKTMEVFYDNADIPPTTSRGPAPPPPPWK